MEFDGNIAKLQGTICSLGAQKMLNNPGSLHNTVAALKEITSSLSDKNKSKATFFMILNTKLSLSEKLKNDEFVGLFTNITPHIEKEYLITYIYHLNLQYQLFEVIENCPGDLGIELLDVIIKKLKEPGFHRDEFGTDHLYQLWQSVFIKICKISRGLHVNYCLEKFLFSFQDIYYLIQKVVVTSTKVQGLEVFTGYHLNNFFKAVLFCLKSSKASNLPENGIYKLSMCLNSNECKIESPVNVCITMIFDKIFHILENITVDLWMTLSECHFDKDSKDSAQMVIGGLVYNILQEAKEFDLNPEVLNCLSNLAINKSEVLAKAGIDEIISNAEENERTWFEALIKHSGFLEKKSIECVISHLHLASAEELTVILNTSYEYLCNSEDGENVDLVKELFLAAVKKSPDCSKWLDKVFEKYQPDLLRTRHTNDEVIVAFNKISKDKNISDRDLISLCMQSPTDIIKRICQLAVSGTHQTEFVIEILKTLRRACGVPFCLGFTLLDSILQNFLEGELSDREARTFVNLIVQLGRQNFLGPLFFNNLLKGLKGFLENETLGKAVLSLEIVKFLLDQELFHVDDAAFLVFMSQVLEHLTWDLKSFSNALVDGRDLAVRIVALIIKRLKVEENGAGLQWAQEEILKCWEGNQAHFSTLWFRRNWIGSGKFSSFILALVHSPRKARDFGKALTGLDRPSDIRTSVVLSLFSLLPVVSFGEWNLIFNRLTLVLENDSGKNFADVHQVVLDLFASSLILLTLNLNRDGDIYPCYMYCLRNFLRLAKRHCPEMKEVSLSRTLGRTVQFLKMIQDKEKRKSCLEICSPVFAEVMNVLKARNAVSDLSNQSDLLTAELKDAAEAVPKSSLEGD